MNYKNNLSLILASTMVSGMFSAAVNAKAYNFTTKDGNLEAYTVTTTDGKNVISGEGSANIELALSASGTKSQKVAFGVSSTFSDEASGELRAAEDTLVKSLKDKAAEVITALKPINAAANVGNVEAHAQAFRDAVEIMAKIKGKMSSASNAQELVSTVKELTFEFARAYAASSGTQAVVANNTFAANALPAGEEDADTVLHRVQRALTNGPAAGGGGANTPVKIGICVGDVVTGIAENDDRKYQVIGSAQIAGNVDLEGAGGNAVAPLSIDNAARISNADFTAVPAAAVGAGLVIVNAAAGRIGANAAVDAAVAGLTAKVQAFFENRKKVDATNPIAGQSIVGNIDKVAQLKKFNEWMKDYFIYRARTFLSTVEGMEIGAEAATWLGAGAVKASNLNKADDYKVTIANGKNLDAISVKKVVDDKVALGAANGATVSPLMVEFIAGTPAKEKTATGTLKISADGMKKAQEIPFSVTVGSVAKTDTVDVDTSAEQTVPSGYTFTKSTVAAIRNAEADDFVINVLPNGTKVEAPVTMTIAKTKQIRTGERKIVAEISEDDNANELYAPEENGKKKNDIAILNASKVSDGKVEYSIPVEVAKEELGELENGAKVYVYLTTTEKLEATKEKKAAAKKAEAKASANDGAVDSTRMIEGKVVDGKIVFTEDPSKISREEDEVFMMSKNKLDIKDAEEASAEEDKEEDEEEAEDEEEEAEEEKAEGEEAATEGAAGAATAGNDALTTEGTVVDEVTANEVPASTEEVSANAANGVAATGATAAAGIFGTMALASLAAGALATKKNKK